MNNNIAMSLWQTKSVFINTKDMFTLTSGKKSPVYIDVRRLISFPEVIKEITLSMKNIIHDKIGLQNIDVIAGGETAGIPYAAFLAYEMNLPMVYIRKQPKGFGKNNKIEGDDIQGKKVFLLEDLTTDFGSKVNFINAIRNAKADVLHVASVFFYNIFPSVDEILKQQNIDLHYLATWQDVFDIGVKEGFCSKNDVDFTINYFNKLISEGNS